jgi:hypothetical protein
MFGHALKGVLGLGGHNVSGFELPDLECAFAAMGDTGLETTARALFEQISSKSGALSSLRCSEVLSNWCLEWCLGIHGVRNAGQEPRSSAGISAQPSTAGALAKVACAARVHGAAAAVGYYGAWASISPASSPRRVLDCRAPHPVTLLAGSVTSG